ncbi:MAG: cellulase family glycosylhydrolase [Oscillospiraceae bacterium]|nr:cellulase family glycosylhydrolase [Oscillospiraceae bacterium]
MKKRFLSLVLTLAILLAFVPAATTQTEAVMTVFNPITGWDMMEKLGLGYTFANTTEARPWPDSNWFLDDTETCWGQPKIEEQHFQSVAQKGFDSYRLCVSWTPHMDTNYQISEVWMDRIQQLADWALDAGLNVVLNTHHEEELYWLIRDGEYEKAKTHLTALWKQVAERFKDYPETLVFEIMNEPMLKEYYDSPEDIWIHDADGQVNKVLRDTVNKLNKDALEVIRKSGGNNARRVVMLCVPGAHPDALPYMEVPDDDPYIMLSTFGYEGFLNKGTLPLVIEWLNKGVGFVNKEDKVGAYEYPATVENMMLHFGRLAELGIPSFYFSVSNNADEGDFFIRHTGEWINQPLLDALFKAHEAFAPYKPPYTSAPPAFVYELGGTFKDMEYTIWNPPADKLAAAEKLVIEIEESIGWCKFAQGDPWMEWEISDDRVTVESRRIMFDIHGLEGNTLGFLTWNNGDAAKIKRAYLAAWDNRQSLSNFAKTRTYEDNFPDLISSTAQTWVPLAYEYGLMRGGTDGTFGSKDNITIEQVLVVASRVHMIYNTGEAESISSMDGWINYARENGIIDGRFIGRYGEDATRAEVAYMMGSILEDKDMKSKNPQTLTAADVPQTHAYYGDIKRFYEAGMVSGRTSGDFDPDAPIIREECAVIFVRVIDEAKRR